MSKKLKVIIVFLLLVAFAPQHTYSQNKNSKNEKELQKELKILGNNLEKLITCGVGELNRALSKINEDDIKSLSKKIQKDCIKTLPGELDQSDYIQQDDLYTIEKIKKINKHFKVGPQTKLELENKFGKILINSWDKNEMTIDINIIARASSDDKATDILEKINIDIAEANDIISFKTKIESLNGNNKNANKSFEINYIVNMPRNNAIKIKNSFGDLVMSSHNGKTDIEVKYGGLKAEKILSNDNFIKLAFGSGSISYLKKGTLDISYSDFNLVNAGSVNLSSGFSDIKFGNIDNLDIKNKYGSVAIGSVKSISGTNSFADFKLDKLASGLDMKITYCGGFEIQNIARNFKLINIEGSYSRFDLDFGGGCSFNFDVNVHFGNADIDKSKADFNIAEKKSTSVYYKGKYGTGPGNGQVVIKSSYGNVSFQNNNNE